MLTTALHFAPLGFRVIPAVGKFGVGGTYSRATVFDRQIVEWFTGPYKNHNLGVVLDEGWVVVDLDTKKDGLNHWAELVGTKVVPPTLTVLTPTGGKHLYFRYNGDRRIKGKESLLAPGVDIWSGNRLMVGPPSIHPDTHTRYQFSGEPDWSLGDDLIADAPEWLTDLIIATESLPSAARPGGRHQDLLRYAVRARSNNGLDAHELFVALAMYRDFKGYPARDKRDSELWDIARSAVARYDFNPESSNPRVTQKLADMQAARESFNESMARSMNAKKGPLD
jgi:hypothetical protein